MEAATDLSRNEIVSILLKNAIKTTQIPDMDMVEGKKEKKWKKY